MSDRVFRTASTADYAEIDRFLSRRNLLIHRHLDWRTPLDWLGTSPFLISGTDNKIDAVFASPPDVHGVYWIRLFATIFPTSIDELLTHFLEMALNQINKDSPENILASIGFHDWMRHTLQKNGFSVYQNVIQLRWESKGTNYGNMQTRPEITIRNMKFSELPDVTAIDQACFNRIWMHSLPAIEKAFQQSAFATVAQKSDEIAGFQISTKYRTHAHIARLAVLPKYQNQGIGSALVANVIEHFRKPWIQEITVNTQNDNEISLSLYTKLGFRLTGESFPILTYKLN